MRTLIITAFALCLTVLGNSQKVDILGDATITGQVEIMDTILFSDGTQLASACLSALLDADNDTGIDVEQSPDDDTIRFFVGNVEIMKMDKKSLQLSASDNGVYIGKDAGKSAPLTGNTWNTMMGYQAGENASGASTSTLIGARSGAGASGGVDNVMIGIVTGEHNTGSFNTLLGNGAGQNSASGSDNTFLGHSAGWTATGSNSIYIGRSAGLYAQGSDNIAIGRHALSTTADKSGLVAIGDSALANNGKLASFPFYALYNTAIGTKSLKRNETGLGNTAVGYKTLENSTSGSHNTAFGYYSLNANQTGFGNIAIGSIAQSSSTSASNNTSVGYESGRFSQGSNNTYLGYMTGTNNVNGHGNVFIGKSAGEFDTSSNTLIIANSSTATPLIYGEFDSSMVRINGRLNVNDAYDLPTTAGVAGQVIAYDGAGKAIWTNPTISSSFSDTDGDTGINFEVNPDDDVIRFYANGTEAMTLDSNQLSPITSLEAENHLTSATAITGSAGGLNGKGVVGEALNPLTSANFGGWFKSAGTTGTGVYGETTGSNGIGVYGKAGGIGSVINYGGYFQAFGANGYGVYAKAAAGSGTGLYAEGAGAAGYFNGDIKTNGLLSLEQLGANYTKGIQWSEFLTPEFSMTFGNESGLFALKIQEHVGTTSTMLYLRHTGKVGINTETPAHPLDIEGSEDADHIVRIKNNSTTEDADGLLIELETAETGSGNNFITFRNDGGITGRIEGFKVNPGGNFSDRPNFAFDDYFDVSILNDIWQEGSHSLANFASCVFSPSCIPLPIPPFLPECVECSNWLQLPTLDLSTMWAPPLLSTAFDDLALAMNWGMENGVIAAIGDPYNLGFYQDPQYWSNLATEKNGGVTYGSKGADYAEWLERRDHAQEMQSGQVVGVRNGKIGLNTTDAEQLLVISMQPAVLGNLPDAHAEADFEKVAFLGQAPVWVVGVVRSGDYIIPSGHHDGYAIALAPDQVTSDHLPLIIGRAWEDASRPVNLVNMAIGLKTNEMTSIMKTLYSDVESLKARLGAIEVQLGMQDVAKH